MQAHRDTDQHTKSYDRSKRKQQAHISWSLHKNLLFYGPFTQWQC